MGLLQRFGIGRVAAVIGIAAGFTAVMAAIFLNLGQPKSLLYSNLDLKEAGSITAALDQAGIKYEVKGDGSTIMVPRDVVASTRLMLSGKGLPTAGSVGYEIFDDASALGQTDFVQQLNRQRALEGELARTIGALDGITSARVHLVLPKRQLFEEEAEQPASSVSIGVGGREPTAEQVRAIQNLVAGAVPNMRPDRVTVVDQHAKTLSGGETGMAAEADGRKSEVEQRISKQVKTLVEGLVGAGKARVNVSADLDLARVTTQEEKYDPDGQVIRSETTTEENSRENSADASGQVSVAANIPGGAQGGDTTANTNTAGRQDSTTNYEISKTIRTEVKEPGTVKRLSVAVAVDGITAVGAGGKPGAYTPRSAEEMQRIEQLVRASVGFDQERGDQISVINVKFPVAAETGGVEAANPLKDFDKNDIMRAVELAVLAIVGILMIFFVARPLLGAGGRKKGKGAAAGGGADGGPPQATRIMIMPDGQQVQVAADGSMSQLALPGPGDDGSRMGLVNGDGEARANRVKQVSEFMAAHPDQSVSILRSWLHETA